MAAMVDAGAFVEQWVRHWNDHDVDAVLEHFAPDVTFSSPVAAQLLPGSDGVIRGRAALRDYWTTALGLIPDLHFEVVASYVGVNTLVINYRNQKGNLVSEVLIFEGPLVVQGHGTYPAGDHNPAGARQA
jgi:ketosteroid isomerase-like protein